VLGERRYKELKDSMAGYSQRSSEIDHQADLDALTAFQIKGFWQEWG
jgi:hypothetical protein